MVKRFVFKYYGWISLVIAVAAAATALRSSTPKLKEVAATALAAALPFCYFAQKQKLDELKLFNELFTRFNDRYDRMNEALEDIRVGRTGGGAARKLLVDYFNLCAEEYLFFKEGYIHPQVWQSWCRGMRYYLQNDGIRQVWNEEMNADSYYGLTIDEVQRGAAD